MRDAVAALALIYMGKMSLLSKIHLAPTYSFEHDLFGKPVPTFPDHALVSFEHDLFGKPVPTPLSKCGAGFFLDHALDAERAAQIIATPLVCLAGFALNKGAVLSLA
jgi:hypothetical protein